MTTTRVEPAAGDGFDLLVSGVAVADREWCAVLTHGPDLRARVQRAGLGRQAAQPGRFGWINLLGFLAQQGGTGSRADLVELVTRTPADEIRFVMAGGLRRQLLEQVGADRLRAALTGDAAQTRGLRAALRSPRLLPDITPWLLRTPAAQVRDTMLALLDAWPVVSDPAASQAAAEQMRTRLAEAGAADVLALVTPGIRYGPSVLDHVLLVSCPHVEPILISVEQTDVTVIVHPPLAETGMVDAASVLRTHGTAVGDATRVLLLQELRPGPCTLADLCSALGRPRTTLLHHLALLRAAGLVSLTVTANEPNVYRLDHRGFDALARAARAFVLE